METTKSTEKATNYQGKSRTWYEVTVKFDQMQDNGLLKPVRERYTIDAMSFAEAEARATEIAAEYVSGDFEVKSCTLAPYRKIFFADGTFDENGRQLLDVEEEKWHKLKVQTIAIDEKTDREKRRTITHLVLAKTIDAAIKATRAIYDRSMLEYIITSAAETKVVEVVDFASKKTEDPDEENTESKTLTKQE